MRQIDCFGGCFPHSFHRVHMLVLGDVREISKLARKLTWLISEVGIIIPPSWNVGNIKKHIYKIPNMLPGKW